MRHTCASLLIHAGANARAVMQQLGHQDIRTTLNTYAHEFPSVEAALADLLDEGYASANGAVTELSAAQPR